MAVIQKRVDGSTDFYKTWVEYKNGFGDPTRNYWIGNDAIHNLTRTHQELRVDLLSFDNETAFYRYSIFQVENESSKYQLNVSGPSDKSGDSLEWHNGMKFTTWDQDNDIFAQGNCGVAHHGGWWYNACSHANLNGRYENSALDGPDHMYWMRWKNYLSLKAVEMKIRPSS
ncbi:ficolin-1-like [Ostrea edulis]|uniref:ficolin-1-like n=1 Tax=Ostrea edulis TaxID=37623 RepID=UPI0024AFF95F|nr:ficolin-1-like [Ostrea edulis]